MRHQQIICMWRPSQMWMYRYTVYVFCFQAFFDQNFHPLGFLICVKITKHSVQFCMFFVWFCTVFCSGALLYKNFHFVEYLYDAVQSVLFRIPILSAKYVPKSVFVFADKNIQKICFENTRMFTQQSVPCYTMKISKQMKIFVQKCMRTKTYAVYLVRTSGFLCKVCTKRYLYVFVR